MKSTQQMLTPRQFAQKRGTSLYFVYHELWANRLPGAQRSVRVGAFPWRH